MLALGAVVVALMPDVNGTLEAEEAPANATGWAVATVFAIAVELAGLRTLGFVLVLGSFSCLMKENEDEYSEREEEVDGD